MTGRRAYISNVDRPAVRFHLLLDGHDDGTSWRGKNENVQQQEGTRGNDGQQEGAAWCAMPETPVTCQVCEMCYERICCNDRFSGGDHSLVLPSRFFDQSGHLSRALSGIPPAHQLQLGEIKHSPWWREVEGRVKFPNLPPSLQLYYPTYSPSDNEV